MADIDFNSKVSYSEKTQFHFVIAIIYILNLNEDSFNIGLNQTPSQLNLATYFGENMK